MIVGVYNIPSPSLEIILPVKLFVLFGYPRRGGQYRQPSPNQIAKEIKIFRLPPFVTVPHVT